MKMVELNVSKISITEDDVQIIYSIINHEYYHHNIIKAYKIMDIDVSDICKFINMNDNVLIDLSEISKNYRFDVVKCGNIIQTYYCGKFGNEERYFDNGLNVSEYIIHMLDEKKYSTYDFEIKTITTIIESLSVKKPSTIVEMVDRYKCDYNDVIFQMIEHGMIYITSGVISLTEFGIKYGGNYDYDIIEWDVTFCDSVLYSLLFSKNKALVDYDVQYYTYDDSVKYIQNHINHIPPLAHENSYFGWLECCASSAKVMQHFVKHGLYDYGKVTKYGELHCEEIGTLYTTKWNYYIGRMIQYNMYIESCRNR
jgi:hypothetical protein